MFILLFESLQVLDQCFPVHGDVGAFGSWNVVAISSPCFLGMSNITLSLNRQLKQPSFLKPPIQLSPQLFFSTADSDSDDNNINFMNAFLFPQRLQVLILCNADEPQYATSRQVLLRQKHLRQPPSDLLRIAQDGSTL